MKSFKYYMLVLGLCLMVMLGCKSSYLRSAKIYLFDVKPPDYKNAVTQLNKEMQTNPNNPEAYFLLGYIYSRQGEYEKMVENFKLAREHNLDPVNNKDMGEMEEKAWGDVFSVGASLANQDSLEQALKWFKLATLIDPKRYEGYLNYCVTTAKMNKFDEAMPYCDKAYELMPEDGNVQNTYAVVLLNAGKYDQALGIYNKILERDPSNINVLTNLAMIYGQSGDEKNAMEIYNKILQADPEHKDAYFNRGVLFMKQAQAYYDQIKQANDALAADPKNKSLETKVKQLLAEQKDLYHRAELDFGKVIDLDPNDNEARGYLGASLFHQEKWDEALPAFEKVVSIDANNREAWNYLAVIYTKKGMKEKGEEALKKAGITQ
jgi:tetratricopeptide (TPR) repeat protein